MKGSKRYDYDKWIPVSSEEKGVLL